VKRIILHLFFLGFKVEETLKGIFEAAEETEEKYDKQTKPGIQTGSVAEFARSEILTLFFFVYHIATVTAPEGGYTHI